MQPSQRVPTHVPGLDEVLYGGLIRDHSYLLVGAAGTGKTITTLQWLAGGAREGEDSLYITLAEPVRTVMQNVESFGWDLSAVGLLDLNPAKEARDAAQQDTSEYSIFPPSEVERGPAWERIYEAIRERQPQRVVIDSLTQLRYLSADEYQFRKQVLALVLFLHENGCTTLITFEPSELEREASVALAVDGIIKLRMEISPHRMIGARSVEVTKLRGSNFMSGFHPMRFTPSGIAVYPHRVEEPSDRQPAQEQLTSGIANLDGLLGGGLDSSTTTIFSGPCGVGKSTLGMQFLIEAVRKGQRAVVYAFEESPHSILARCRALGMPVDAMQDSDALKMVRVNPMELYPDEFLWMLRCAVEDESRQVVMIDSLRGYHLAMEEFGSSVAHVYNMVTYLNRMQVTSILINEVEEITGGSRATDIGVSYIADAIVLLRYAEYEGRVIKVIACLKKRHGAFDSALRELEITPGGIEVGQELTRLRGILTGTPVTTSPSPSLAPSIHERNP